jgi:hypothetical protein
VLEVSVFGGGFGECICLHLADGVWCVIDSCLDPATGEPASLVYLRSLGVDPAIAVKLIVVTHWDDDHIRGISEVVRVCADATVACSLALTRDDFLQLVMEEEQNAGGTGTGVDELRSVLRLSNGRRVWAKNNTPLYPRPRRDGPSVVALSPSEGAVERGIMELAEKAHDRPRAVARKFRAPEESNGASVVAFAESNDTGVLLGADLEASTNPETGWDAVIAEAAPPTQAALVKVPHHGSDDAHHAEMWEKLVEAGAVALVTPFTNGSVQRPTPEDIQRLCDLGIRLYATALPRLTKARLPRDVERVVQRAHGGAVVEVRGWGHVRARRNVGQGHWQVELDGDGELLCSPAA